MANMPQGGDSNARLKRFLVIMDSMTNAELDGKVQLDESRIMRVARGAGVHPQEVVGTIDTYKQFEKMIDGMNKGGLLKGGDAAFQSKMQRNPNAVLAQMQKSMDPRMLRGMGGMGGLSDLMKGLAKVRPRRWPHVAVMRLARRRRHTHSPHSLAPRPAVSSLL